MDPIELELDSRIAVARTRLAKLRELASLETAIEEIATEVLVSKAMLRHIIKELSLMVGLKFGVDPALIRAPFRGEQPIADARMLVMYVCRKKGLGTTVAIARELRRDHGTVSHAVKSINARMQTNAQFRGLVGELLRDVDIRMKELIGRERDENDCVIHEGSEVGQGAGRASV